MHGGVYISKQKVYASTSGVMNDWLAQLIVANVDTDNKKHAHWYMSRYILPTSTSHFVSSFTK